MLLKNKITTRNIGIYNGERSNCGNNILVENIDDVGGIISSNSDLLEITFEIDANGILSISICSSENQKHNINNGCNWDPFWWIWILFVIIINCQMENLRTLN